MSNSYWDHRPHNQTLNDLYAAQQYQHRQQSLEQEYKAFAQLGAPVKPPKPRWLLTVTEQRAALRKLTIEIGVGGSIRFAPKVYCSRDMWPRVEDLS